MTWARFDDAAATHPKARVAGNEAWALWVAAVIYCNRYLTDGFIPFAALATDCLPVPIAMAKAKKLAEKLCEARLRPDGPGLFVRVNDGYIIHDFLNWNESKSDVENKRKIDRDRKRGARASKAESSDSPKSSPLGHRSGIQSESVPQWSGMVGMEGGVGESPAVVTAAEPPAPSAPATTSPASDLRQDPNPSLPPASSPADPPAAQRSRARATKPKLARAARWTRVPADWSPNADHAALAGELFVNLATETSKFRDHEFRAPKSDADAAFRRWLRQASQYADQRFTGPMNGRNYGPPSAVQVALARVAEHQQGAPQEPSVFDDWNPAP